MEIISAVLFYLVMYKTRFKYKHQYGRLVNGLMWSSATGNLTGSLQYDILQLSDATSTTDSCCLEGAVELHQTCSLYLLNDLIMIDAVNIVQWMRCDQVRYHIIIQEVSRELNDAWSTDLRIRGIFFHKWAMFFSLSHTFMAEVSGYFWTHRPKLSYQFIWQRFSFQLQVKCW